MNTRGSGCVSKPDKHVMNQHFAAHESPTLCGKGRGVSRSLGTTATPFYSAMVRLLEVGQTADFQAEAINLAKRYAANKDLTGLQFALSAVLADAAKITTEVKEITALFPQPDIEDATQVYGERT